MTFLTGTKASNCNQTFYVFSKPTTDWIIVQVYEIIGCQCVYDRLHKSSKTTANQLKYLDLWSEASVFVQNVLTFRIIWFPIMINSFKYFSDWMTWASQESILRVLMCLRILMRDSTYQKYFFEQGGVKQMSEYFMKATDSYLSYGDGTCMVDILKEMTSKLTVKIYCTHCSPR